MNHLLHPEIFDLIPLTGHKAASNLNARADEIAGSVDFKDPDLTIAIRTLNERQRLEELFKDIADQAFNGEVEVVVVDNESSDGTPDLARSFGAEVITIPRDEFTYPRSMNASAEAASHDIIMLTVGHARLSNDQNLRAGSNYFTFENVPNVGGVSSWALPNDNASRLERLAAIRDFYFLRNPLPIQKAGFGVLAATGSMISRPVWEELGGFDERYEWGGEDTAFAKTMLEAGYLVFTEPALSVHHTHGLGTIDSMKQLSHWLKTLNGPTPLDMAKLAARRPDIDFS